ncbi:MAG: hypothetical protein EOR25_30085 [Mesorhizobium sp.]|uniref:hypothetical protein n=1 Tax=Mesorhizobium sp. TaxID=1871066 RepID=UPI000FE4009E|nr:hypothetical protein [Mesorhizobium sp.]RWJ04893.1 MAG: hypothetical protein EOR24_29980 [Mesorhizobium sp.]RWJ11949.1 MAG: hypothetical protein EOR25_30085 [Mesorhizobium sp.]
MTPPDLPASKESVAPVTSTEESSYVDWPAIFAGTIFASAISVVLLAFGSALGLAFADFDEESGGPLIWFALAAALWMLWVQVSSYFAGGYLAGRLRRRIGDASEYESDIRDGSHGLIVWAVGVVFSTLIALSGAAGVAATAVGSASMVTAGAAAGPDDADAGTYDLVVDRFLRGNATSQTPPARETRDEVGRILIASVADGSLNEADRQYLTATIAARAGIDAAAAQQRVDALLSEAQAAAAEAREVADNARKVALMGAFLTAATLFVSAVAAYYAATLGGKHRDERTEVAGWYKPW